MNVILGYKCYSYVTHYDENGKEVYTKCLDDMTAEEKKEFRIRAKKQMMQGLAEYHGLEVKFLD